MSTSKEEQREFFEEFKRPKRGVERFRAKYASHKRFFVTLSVENLVLASIIIIMVVVLSFSLGVERGKGISSTAGTRLGTGVSKINRKSRSVLSAEKTRPKDSAAEASRHAMEGAVSLTKDEVSRYTIQVATFSEETTAIKVIDSLKKQGFSAFILSNKGKFHVCTGRYSTKKEAVADLSKFKDRYGDCFVRNIE